MFEVSLPGAPAHWDFKNSYVKGDKMTVSTMCVKLLTDISEFYVLRNQIDHLIVSGYIENVNTP